jgi:predicted RNA-binding Zn-ribbon protein involved in translation (DUF1610 family)
MIDMKNSEISSKPKKLWKGEDLNLPDDWKSEHQNMCMKSYFKESYERYTSIFDNDEEISKLNEIIKEKEFSKKQILEYIKTENNVSIKKEKKDEVKAINKELKDLKKERKELINIRRNDPEYVNKIKAINEEDKQILKEILSKSSISDHRDELRSRFFSMKRRMRTKKEYSKIRTKDVLKSNILFKHHCGGGGTDINNLFKPNNKCRIELSEDRSKRQIGKFVYTLQNGTSKEFLIKWHRPLPTNAILKNIILSGKINNGKVIWYVLFNIDSERTVLQSTSRTKDWVTIDTGWKFDNENGFRFATIMDTKGHIENMYIPKSSSYIKKVLCPNCKEEIEFKGRNRFKEDDIYLCNKCGYKGKLRYEPGKSSLIHKKNRLLSKASILNESNPEEAKRLRNKANILYRRFINDRKYLFYRVAHKLCKEYPLNVIEKIIYSKLQKEYNRSSGSRQAVAVGEFISVLKYVASKYKTKIVEENSHYTTRRCIYCMNIMEKTSNTMLNCENCGRTFDRDENACKNLMYNFLNKEKEGKLTILTLDEIRSF